MILCMERMWLSRLLSYMDIEVSSMSMVKIVLATNITDRSILTCSTDRQSLQRQATFLWSGSVWLTCIIVKTYPHPHICKIQSWKLQAIKALSICAALKNALHIHKSSAGKIFCLQKFPFLHGSLFQFRTQI